jgi:hypothetical protein
VAAGVGGGGPDAGPGNAPAALFVGVLGAAREEDQARR